MKLTKTGFSREVCMQVGLPGLQNDLSAAKANFLYKINTAKVQSLHAKPGLQIFSAATSKMKPFCFGQTAWPQAYAI